MSGFLAILTDHSPEPRRILWQRAFERLVRENSGEPPTPLDEISPGLLDGWVSQALREGWLAQPSPDSPPGEALALQALELALPPGPSRQALSERVQGATLGGPASLFAALMERRILSGEEPPEPTAAQQARVTLCMILAPGQCPDAAALALALLVRPASARRWLAEDAHRSLPQRRTAARLLERAAQGAVAKSSDASGDGWVRRLLGSEAFEVGFPRLLNDREPLVWHHAALARGFLAPHHEPFQQAILAGLSPEQTPTEWRRAGTSLVAWAGRAPDKLLPTLERLLRSGLLRRHQGLGGVLTRGLGAAAEGSQEAAREIFRWLFQEDPLGAAEALSDAMERGFAPTPEQLQQAITALSRPDRPREPQAPQDDGLDALWAERLAELRRGHEGSALGALDDALVAYATRGAAAACALAREAVQQVEGSVALLALLDDAAGSSDDETEVRRRLFSLLHQTQRCVLQDDRLDALLDLGALPDDSDERERLITTRDWLTEWILLQTPPACKRGSPLHHQSLHIQKLRTLLYAADAHTRQSTPQALAGAHRRRQRIAVAMLERLRSGVPPELSRATGATLARALDALLRVGDLAPTDVLFLVLREELGVGTVRVLIEASVNQEVESLLGAYLAAFQEDLAGGTPGELAPASIPPTLRPPGAEGEVPEAGALPVMFAFHHTGERLRRLRELAQQIPLEASLRAEACRRALQGYGDALRRLLEATSLREAVQDGGGMALLERSWFDLLQQIASAEQRIGSRSEPLVLPRPALPALQRAIERQDPGEAEQALSAAQIALERTLPPPLASLASPIVGSLLALPLLPRPRPGGARPLSFPTWVPEHRILGAFRLLSPAGSGGAGSVFIARRAEDPKDREVERFALKVPEYGDVAARTLSEEQFYQLFREEASALLNLPTHPNLARFVTFDLAARPRPILVMELVEGIPLDQLLTGRPLDRRRALDILDGVLAGLEAMHATGIGHLDIKPQNVILRGGEVPVLVDFGLSGRTLRPGCGSLAYSAPEVWLGPGEQESSSPWSADIYAVACLAYELLTGEPLFNSGSEVVAIAAHLAHDGWPAGLQARRSLLGELALVLHDALRRSPADRLTAARFRQRLRAAR